MTACTSVSDWERPISGNVAHRFPRILSCCCWLLIFATFSLPGRDAPNAATGLDWVALLKLAVRFSILGVFSLFVLARWRTRERTVVLWSLAPLILFAFWAVLSVIWSPLKAVSLGQASGLIVLLLLAVNIGLWARDPRATSDLLCSLNWALLAFNSVFLIASLVSPELGSLDRLHPGIVHPTGVASASSVGLLLLCLCRLLWGWTWTRRLFLPGTIIYVSVILLTASRTTLFASALVIGVAVFVYVSRGLVWAALFACSLAAACYLTLDPGMNLTSGALDKVTQYVHRDDSSSVSELSGRVELWGVIWNSYLESPWVGHGYFVSSSTGELYAWYVWANYTAHNVALQALVTTGVIGASLVFLGLGLPYVLMLGYCHPGTPHRRNIARLVTLFAGWYFIWSLMNASFLGPLSAESVVFYTLLGLVVSTLPVPRDMPVIAARFPGRQRFERFARHTYGEFS